MSFVVIFKKLQFVTSFATALLFNSLSVLIVKLIIVQLVNLSNSLSLIVVTLLLINIKFTFCKSLLDLIVTELLLVKSII